jgi:DGQHR domain-containing protein
MVDGQHRAKGLQAAKQLKQPLPYSLPVVFTLGLNEEEEMNLFYVVNSTQKSVPTDLTAEIMRKRIDAKAKDGKAHITISELRRAASTQIARALALSPKSVWYDKIQMADEIKQYQKPIRLATFAHSLEPYLAGDWAHNMVFAREIQPLADVVEAYWEGLRLLMPAAFDEPRVYTVQSPTGAWVFGWVLRDMVRLADKASNWAPEFFADQLRCLSEWVDSQTWHREYGDDLTRARGSGVARLIFEKIYPLYRDALLTMPTML